MHWCWWQRECRGQCCGWVLVFGRYYRLAAVLPACPAELCVDVLAKWRSGLSAKWAGQVLGSSNVGVGTLGSPNTWPVAAAAAAQCAVRLLCRGWSSPGQLTGGGLGAALAAVAAAAGELPAAAAADIRLRDSAPRLAAASTCLAELELALTWSCGLAAHLDSACCPAICSLRPDLS